VSDTEKDAETALEAPCQTSACGSFGKGDEAGGGAPSVMGTLATSADATQSIVSSDSPPPSRSPRGVSADSFATEEKRLQFLLEEIDETFFPDEFSNSTSFEGASPQDSMLVRNLDTGEWKNMMRISEDENQDMKFCGRWEDPSCLTRSGATPWQNLHQEIRQNNEELWKVAGTGQTGRLCDLLSPIVAVPDMEAVAKRLGSVNMESSIISTGSGIAAHDSRGDSIVVGSGPSAASDTPPIVTGGLLKVNIDSRSLHGRTAMHIAASNGQDECVEVLLKAKADINVQTDAGFTALHLASERGCISIVRSLLAAECDPGVQTKQGELALHLAAAKGHTTVLSELLTRCTHDLLGTRNNFGQRPAEVCQDIETTSLLNKRVPQERRIGGRPDFPKHIKEDSYAGRTPFHSVLLRNSRADVVRRLLQRTGADHKFSQDGCQEEPGADGAAGPSSGSRNRKKRPVHDRSERRSHFSKLTKDSVEAVGPNSFTLQAVLGKGSFGEVYQVIHRNSGQVYAMKVLRKNKIFGRNLTRYAMTERNLLSYIRHPFIVRLYYAFQTPTCLVLVLHYCPGGNLSSLIAHEGRLQEVLAQLYIAEVFLAIEYLHERQVVYRDLKPENVVLDELGHAMLTDFGLSKEGVMGPNGTKSFCGSVAYLAPEILARKGHGPMVDLYGLGVLLFEMLSGRPPYYSRDRETLFKNIVSASLNVPSTASTRAHSLIQGLMRRDPAQRIGARKTSEVRSHPFFGGVDFDSVLAREVPVPAPRRQRPNTIQEAAAKVANPFEGRLEASMRKRLSSNSQDVTGWEFGAAVAGDDIAQANPRHDRSSRMPTGASRMAHAFF
jgi:protein-serine/threonine kinase